MSKLLPIHPFPARMAPEIAYEAIKNLPAGSTVLDPMLGSGTTAKIASLNGHRCIGFDIDPLSILISKAWSSCVPQQQVIKSMYKTLESTVNLKKDIHLPWIDDDLETKRFIDYWFAPQQRDDLRKLSYLITNHSDPGIQIILKVALSKLIITKDKGASLARDVSHGKPHKVRSENDYNVIDNFEKVVTHITKKANVNAAIAPQIGLCDARRLADVDNDLVDLIITSPPYLHAVEYMRGHKLSLVWLGYSLKDLRKIKESTIGTPIRPTEDADILKTRLLHEVGELHQLPLIKQKHVLKYAVDLYATVKEFHRVLKQGGKATVVIFSPAGSPASGVPLGGVV